VVSRITTGDLKKKLNYNVRKLPDLQNWLPKEYTKDVERTEVMVLGRLWESLSVKGNISVECQTGLSTFPFWGGVSDSFSSMCHSLNCVALAINVLYFSCVVLNVCQVFFYILVSVY
jgi:hypothetical protein